MAWYASEEVRYKGRLVEVNTRYGSLSGAGGIHILKGKPLLLKRKDIRKIWRILLKKAGRGESTVFEPPY